jgi:hypothetical protein
MKEFLRLLADRSISWKLRATIDYSEANIDKEYLDAVEKRAEELANKGGGVNRKDFDQEKKKPITEDE